MEADCRNIYTSWTEKHTYTILVCAHVLRKFRPTQLIGAEKAEVTWHLPHYGGRQSLVETQEAISFQDCLHHCPHCAEDTPQITTQSKVHQWKHVNMSVTLTSSVRLQSCQLPPFHAWPASDTWPARWGIRPWQRRWRPKSLLMPSVCHWWAMEKQEINMNNFSMCAGRPQLLRSFTSLSWPQIRFQLPWCSLLMHKLRAGWNKKRIQAINYVH